MEPTGEEDFAIVAQGNLDHVRELRGVLKSGGVAAELMRPPEGRGSS